jgi:hypothetical protein
MSNAGVGSADDRAKVLATQRNRWTFLRHLYDAREELPAGQTEAESAADVGQAIGLSDNAELDRISSYLADAGLVMPIASGPFLRITVSGIDAVERALAAPEESTQHFLPVDVLNGAGDGSQPVDWQGLRALLPQLRDALRPLSGDDAAVATAHVETLEAQSKSPAPSHTIVRESLKSLRTILEGAGGGVGAEAIKALLISLEWL